MMDAKTWDVITVGDVFVDLILSGLPAWPQPGEEVFAQRFAREIGGGAAITACGLARWGMRVSLLAVLGCDEGEWMKRRLTACGVDTRQLIWHDEEPTAVTVSVSREGDRMFFTYMGANRALPEWLAKESTWMELRAARHVHLACAPEPSVLISLGDFLHEHGTSLSLDVGWHPEWLQSSETRRALCVLDLFFPSEREAFELTGERDPESALRALVGMGISRIALKRGSAGAMLLWNGELFAQEAYPVSPVDTTGAGDCFDAGFLYAWLSGESPERCLQIATLCGALSTRRLGGVAAFPTKEEIEEALRRISAGSAEP
ncbi:MAG: carbohydrate kinase family protein [Blastocatellia bacterium]|nr:carbohydrate kinase family protein [Blastocatellia bacterium]MDW8256375.1 carbohydrate kinase family protein [Acidobacteriota bacterium]